MLVVNQASNNLTVFLTFAVTTGRCSISQFYNLRAVVIGPLSTRWMPNFCVSLPHRRNATGSLKFFVTLSYGRLTRAREFPWTSCKFKWCISYFVPVACFSKVPKLFGRISSDVILFVSSQRRRLEARNFAVISIFIPFTTYEKTGFTG